MKKNLYGIIIGFVFGVCLVGCTSITNAEQDNPIKIWAENDNGNYHTLKVIDEETGVNYIVVSTEIGGGHRSISITPRYNSDGTLHINE